MRRLLILFSTFALSGAFLFIPEETVPYKYFPFSNELVERDTYVYFLFEHVILVLLALAVISEATEYLFALRVFVAIEVADTIDYVLFYGEPWSPYFPSWNLIKVTVFGLAIVYEHMKSKL